jgi:hypothetical protein
MDKRINANNSLGALNFSTNSAGLQLDLVGDSTNQFHRQVNYDDRAANILEDINAPYIGKPRDDLAAKNSFNYCWMKWLGDRLSSCSAACPQTCNTCNIMVPQGFVGLVKEAGRYVRKLRPGYHSINTFLDKVELVDMRAHSMSLPHQNVLSKDSVTFSIDAAINYRVINPEIAYFNIRNSRDLVRNIAEAALKCVIGQNTFSTILTQREKINKAISAFMHAKLEKCGMDIDMVETQSINLGSHLHRAMAMVVEAQNRIKSQVIEAKGDVESAKILVEAAKGMTDNPAAVTLMGWASLEQIAHHGCNSIVVPNDILSRFRDALHPSVLEDITERTRLKQPDTPFD